MSTVTLDCYDRILQVVCLAVAPVLRTDRRYHPLIIKNYAGTNLFWFLVGASYLVY